MLFVSYSLVISWSLLAKQLPQYYLFYLAFCFVFGVATSSSPSVSVSSSPRSSHLQTGSHIIQAGLQCYIAHWLDQLIFIASVSLVLKLQVSTPASTFTFRLLIFDVGIPTVSSIKLPIHLAMASYTKYAYVKCSSGLSSSCGIWLLFLFRAEDCNL